MLASGLEWSDSPVDEDDFGEQSSTREEPADEPARSSLETKVFETSPIDRSKRPRLGEQPFVAE